VHYEAVETQNCRIDVEITKYLLFASRQAIRGVSLDASPAGLTPPEAIPPILNSESTFVAVDYDAADDYIYYSDIRRSSIHRIHTNGTGIDCRVKPRPHWRL